MADITFQCPECKQHLAVDFKATGLQVPCPTCSRSITVPLPSPEPPVSPSSATTTRFSWLISIAAVIMLGIVGLSWEVHLPKLKKQEQARLAGLAQQEEKLNEEAKEKALRENQEQWKQWQSQQDEQEKRLQLQQDKAKTLKAAVEAAQLGNLSAVRAFVTADGNLLNAQDSEGNTLLRLALIRNHKELVTFLVSKGADPTITNNNGMSALTMAQTFGETAILGLDKATSETENKSDGNDIITQTSAKLPHRSLQLDGRLLASIPLSKLDKDAEYLYRNGGIALVYEFYLFNFHNEEHSPSGKEFSIIYVSPDSFKLTLREWIDWGGTPEERKALRDARLISDFKEETVTFWATDIPRFTNICKQYDDWSRASAVAKPIGYFGDADISFIPPDKLNLSRADTMGEENFNLQSDDVTTLVRLLDSLPELKERVTVKIKQDIADAKAGQ